MLSKKQKLELQELELLFMDELLEEIEEDQVYAAS